MPSFQLGDERSLAVPFSCFGCEMLHFLLLYRVVGTRRTLASYAYLALLGQSTVGFGTSGPLPNCSAPHGGSNVAHSNQAPASAYHHACYKSYWQSCSAPDACQLYNSVVSCWHCCLISNGAIEDGSLLHRGRGCLRRWWVCCLCGAWSRSCCLRCRWALVQLIWECFVLASSVSSAFGFAFAFCHSILCSELSVCLLPELLHLSQLSFTWGSSSFQSNPWTRSDFQFTGTDR